MPKPLSITEWLDAHPDCIEVGRSYVLGVDPSVTGTGIVVLNDLGELVVMERFPSDSKHWASTVHGRILRYDAIAACIKDVLIAKDVVPTVSCIEGYSLGSNKAQHSAIIECGFVLRMMLVNLTKTHVLEVTPTSLKKFCTGRGDAKGKAPVASALTHRYNVLFSTDDEADAYGLARLALQIAGFEQPQTQQQREVRDLVVNWKPANKPKKKRSQG